MLVLDGTEMAKCLGRPLAEDKEDHHTFEEAMLHKKEERLKRSCRLSSKEHSRKNSSWTWWRTSSCCDARRTFKGTRRLGPLGPLSQSSGFVLLSRIRGSKEATFLDFSRNKRTLPSFSLRFGAQMTSME